MTDYALYKANKNLRTEHRFQLELRLALLIGSVGDGLSSKTDQHP